MTAQALEVIAQHQFPVHAITKGDLVVRDLDLWREINRVYAAVSFSITTADDDLGKKVEPGAALVSQRFTAMARLAEVGIMTGVTMMPILPFIEDNGDNIAAIVARAKSCGAAYIVASFGVTLRDRQRAYYYAQLDRLFPGLRSQYERQYSQCYSASARNAKGLEQLFKEVCERHGIATRMPFYHPAPPLQPALF
jgi:DNA repair photolyase